VNDHASKGFGEDILTDDTLTNTALEVLTNHRRLREISSAYAREWPRLNERLQPILSSLSSDMQETVQRDMTLIRESILDANERLDKAAAALLVAADAGRGVVELSAQIVCRLELITQNSSVTKSTQSNVVYLPARRQRQVRHDLATVSGQCRIAESENRALGRLIDELETGLGQLTGVLEPSAAMDA
jgi:hypothetical protein